MDKINAIRAPAREQSDSASVAKTQCFHCGLPVPSGADFEVLIDGRLRPMCCRGCAAVAQAIVDGGLTDFYKYRTTASVTGHELIPQQLRQARVYDNPQVQDSFVRREGAVREASLILEGIVCAACVWLNEHHLQQLPGVLDVQINYATHRARVRWDAQQIQLSEILTAIREIGYVAHPYDPSRQQEILENERRRLLRRLGVAGALGMQVMVLAVALYAGAFSGIEAEHRRFFHWVSLVLTLPVLVYSAQPFFQAALRDLRRIRAGMDVPVALGISIAFAGSVWATITDQGHVYFDSVVMFVFFLLAARYFELAARRRAADTQEQLVRSTPAVATVVLRAGGQAQREQVIPVAELEPGDQVLVRPGEAVPADGRIVAGRSSVDEALLTGESIPLARKVGDVVIGGSINVESPLTVEVERTGQDTILSGILRMLDRAQTEKPWITRLADRVAGVFVAAVLLLAAAVALYWWWVEPDAWLPVTVAVLVVTCPCALSLATPTAVTAATGRLTQLGLLATRGHALETLARATHVVFDKTGTLTQGRLELRDEQTFGALGKQACRILAAALERESEHPVARALVEAAGGTPVPTASDVSNTPGSGIEGVVDGRRYFIGNPEFVAERSGHRLSADRLGELRQGGRTVVVLADNDSVLSAYALEDSLRAGAQQIVAMLRAADKQVMLLSGDHEAAVRHVAETVGIAQPRWALSPRDKLDVVKALQKQGAVVAMVGDGVNDAPVLAAAQVSVAMASGTDVAAASADIVLMSNELSHLGTGLQVARRMLGVIRQNLAWAVLYNLLALPAAAAGLIAPWMAALGMSASSLLVVGNAMRLLAARGQRSG